ncbi:MAG: hypothetical protein ACRCZR_02210 [Cetobacterium sp.]
MATIVKITSGDTLIQVLAETLEYKFDDLDDSGFDKNNKYIIKIKFTGKISEKTKDETLKFLEWSLNTSKDVYRDVEIEVRGTNEELRRVYKLEGAFIGDYIESFEDKADGIYTVNLIQRKENTENEKVKFYAE